ncbi:hypothetical protein ACJX0J_013354, partial [Zea mays]
YRYYNTTCIFNCSGSGRVPSWQALDTANGISLSRQNPQEYSKRALPSRKDDAQALGPSGPLPVASLSLQNAAGENTTFMNVKDATASAASDGDLGSAEEGDWMYKDAVDEPKAGDDWWKDLYVDGKKAGYGTPHVTRILLSDSMVLVELFFK